MKSARIVARPLALVAACAAAPLRTEAGLVMISPSNTAPGLTSDLAGNAGERRHKGYYRTACNDLHLGRAVADFLFLELGFRRVVLASGVRRHDAAARCH